MTGVVAVDPAYALTPDGFAEIQDHVLESQIKIFPARSWYPSSIGHPCDRYQVWRATRWEEQQPHEPTLQSIFNEGRLHQPAIYAALESFGFEIVREQDRPKQYKVRGAVISGRPDGRLIGFRGTKYTPARLLEAKSASGFEFDRIRTVADIRTAPSHWTRSYYAQGQIYCFLEDLEEGVFVVKSKATGMLKLIPFTLDLAYVEEILRRIERLQPSVEQGVDPEPIPYEWNVCGGCGFRGQCYPPKSFGEGASVLEDPVLVEQLAQREALKAAKREYDELDKAVKATLKHEGIKFAMVGPFIVEGKLVHKHEYTVKAHDEIHYDVERVG